MNMCVRSSFLSPDNNTTKSMNTSVILGLIVRVWLQWFEAIQVLLQLHENIGKHILI